jgi:hypothetical protein
VLHRNEAARQFGVAGIDRRWAASGEEDGLQAVVGARTKERGPENSACGTLRCCLHAVVTQIGGKDLLLVVCTIAGGGRACSGSVQGY